MRNQRAVAVLLLTLLGMSQINEGIQAQECDPIERQQLTGSEAMHATFFGVSVAVFGDDVLIGAEGDNDNGNDAGAAYYFVRDGDQWVEETKLVASDGFDFDLFGRSVALWGEVAVIGAPGDDDMGFFAGSAYIFRRDGREWVEEAKLLPPEGHPFGSFGTSVAISGDTVLIGEMRDDANGDSAGAAYVYRFGADGWQMEAKLTASDGAAFDFLGISIALSGNVALIGASGHGDAGAAYVFRRNGAEWVEEAKLTASDGAARDFFGNMVAASGDVLVVGAEGDDGNGNQDLVGSAYVFRRMGGQWVEEAKLTAWDGVAADAFGNSLAIRGDVIAAGVRKEFSGEPGAVYVYHRRNGQWVEEAKVQASDGQGEERFGQSVALEENMMIVGAFLDHQDFSGSAYIFDLNCGPALSILGSCPGDMRFKVEGATSNEQVAYIYAEGTGSVEIPPGNPCAGTVLGLNMTAMLADVVTADGDGMAKFDVRVPGRACGQVYMQAIDLETCATTNVVPVE
ncbi:MAG: hypothetical protein HND57_13100 [Planctomycetes bacterium]|nr:hypothetical protein [Planctomycetota bacterium]